MICPYCGNLIAYNSYFDAFYCPKCGGFFKQATVVECNDLNEPLALKDGEGRMTDKRKDCPMRHENGNCTVAGGFCTAVNNPICEALHNAFDCGYRSAIRQQEHFREFTKKVEPLTLDELRKMDGEPVWVSVSNNWRESGVSEGWCIVRFHSEDDRVRVYVYDTRHGARFFAQQDYGESWWAYRQKPEEGTI